MTEGLDLAAPAGLDLRRVRNHRGLKPFQLARANGHSTIARQLCDTRSSTSRRRRRRRNAEGAAGGGSKATTPEALLTMLIQVCCALQGCAPVHCRRGSCVGCSARG